MDARPGTYALILRADAVRRVRVGRLGELVLEPGFYAYVGSALGPGGVSARVRRHRRSRNVHWHVDSLRDVATLVEVWYAHDPARREHAWAEALLAQPGATCPLPGFGASDCRCASHLAFFRSRPSMAGLRRALGPGGASVRLARGAEPRRR